MENREWINPDPRYGQPSAEERRKTNKPYIEKEKPSDERESEANTASGRDDE